VHTDCWICGSAWKLTLSLLQSQVVREEGGDGVSAKNKPNAQKKKSSGWGDKYDEEFSRSPPGSPRGDKSPRGGDKSLMAKLGKKRDEEVSGDEFCQYFHRVLTTDKTAFDAICDRWLDAGYLYNSSKYKRSENDAERLRRELEELRRQLGNVKADSDAIRKLQAQIKDLEEQLRRLKQESVSDKKQIQDLGKNNKELTTQAGKDKKRIKELEDQLAMAKMQTSEDKKTITNLSRDNKNLEEELRRLRRELEDAKTKLAKMEPREDPGIMKRAVKRWLALQKFGAFSKFRDEASRLRQQKQTIKIVKMRLGRKRTTSSFDKLREYAEVKLTSLTAYQSQCQHQVPMTVQARSQCLSFDPCA
jgi:DNA repair exonuclease SbcCD ATPase subunit